MSVFKDLLVRSAMNEHLLLIGNPSGVLPNERVIDLSTLGIPNVSGEYTLQITAGEAPDEGLTQDNVWVETFLVKSPQFIRTPSPTGISLKLYQYVLWIKSNKECGIFDNECISGMLEQHFPNNMHLILSDGDVLTILKTYQQPLVIADNDTGRFFNRVSIECELYYNNNN